MSIEIRILESREQNSDKRNCAAIVNSTAKTPKQFALIDTIKVSEAMQRHMHGIVNGEMDKPITITRANLLMLMTMIGSESYAAGVQRGKESQDI